MQRHKRTREQEEPRASKPGLLKRSAKKLRDFAHGLLYPGRGRKGADPTVVDPLIIKAQIPRSHFTRKGPGVEKSARRAFAGFTAAQQHYACSRGWFPETWSPVTPTAPKIIGVFDV